MKRGDFIKLLKKHGVVFEQHGARHDVFVHTATGKHLTVPRHAEMSDMFLRKVLAEIPRDLSRKGEENTLAF